MSKKILLEVCCGSVDDAFESQQGGADRVELNSCLFFGGLTPTVGSVIEAKKRLKIPVIVMIRPRGGGFCYTESEINVMEHDARVAIENGADGLVFGILNENGTIDLQRSERFMKVVGDRVPVVFHRAFDVIPEPFKAVDQLVDLGVKRILTTGQKNYVYEGIPLLKELISYAGDRIEILPGGAIAGLINEIIDKTGCSQVHMASFVTRYDNSTAVNPEIFYGAALYPPENAYQLIDRNAVGTMRSKLNSCL